MCYSSLVAPPSYFYCLLTYDVRPRLRYRQRPSSRAQQNKWEHISERALDDVLEHLNTLNEYTPKIRCSGKSVDPALIFSIDSKLFRDPTLGPQQIEGNANGD